MLRSRQLLGTCALIVLVLGLGLQSTVALNIIEKVARAFAHQQLSSVQPSHRLSLQPFAELEVGSTIARAEATVASKATAEVEDKVDLPSDDRSPATPTPITTPAAEEELPSDSLDPDVALKLAQRSAPAPARTNSLQSLAREAAATAPASASGEMRFREASTERASATAQLHADMQEQTEARVGRTRVGLLPSLGGIGKRAKDNVNKLMGKNVVHQAEIIEDCVACRYIWSQVEMDVANARYAEDVQASFEHNCLDAQKAPIFYNACEDMYDDMYAMTDDYMSQALTVDDMCMKAKMCQDPSKKSFSLFG